MGKCRKISILIPIVVLILISKNYAEIDGTKAKQEVTEGPLVQYQTPSRMPRLINNGWYRSFDNKWYFLDDASRPKTGWHKESADGQWYYFEPPDGVMVTGYKIIGDLRYYFSEQIVSNNWEYSNTLGTYVAKNIGVKSLGSLYMNEYTPDGSFANENGVIVDYSEVCK